MSDQTMTADSADMEKNKGMAILAYIIFFIPLLAAKDSPFAMYHANQGTWLAIISLIVSVIGFVTSFVGIGLCILSIYPIFYIVYAILGIMNVSNGKMEPLPGFASLPVLFK